ncbi:hypothetical protein [Psychrobacter aestuarii]|uniref:Uncharacterized protein n=1 Tax=Psychrobacter aestuarii TaxID=556327 RepID=A0ABN0VRP2_9GAMM|nr:hypothetical protein [Psychrobacter aestuarii]
MQEAVANILDEDYGLPKNMSEQRAYSVCVPNMPRCTSVDEHNVMILNALEAICLHIGCADKNAAPHDKPAAVQASEGSGRSGTIWMQIYSDTCKGSQSCDVEDTPTP